MKVFLGGTVSTSKWRDIVMPMLEIDYFNPVVEDWNEEAYQRELYEREHCDYCLYILTPHMEGLYSIAEVADDSFKKNDKTIFCYLPHDGDKSFSEIEIAEMERVGALIIANGGVWKKTLQETVDFLNSAKYREVAVTGAYTDVFISYGRRHSIAFARKLYNHLSKIGYRSWFDMNDIPLGVDFQAQIDDGIRKASNFLYVMSPHSINSVYCYKELVLALKYNKRIIPILHVEPQDAPTWAKIDPEIGKRNWIYFRQNQDAALAISQKAFALRDGVLELPAQEWGFSDDFDTAFNGLHTLLESHKSYVNLHTLLLDKALTWIEKGKNPAFLSTGKERQMAYDWLLTKEFFTSNKVKIQAPCEPTNEHAEYICESKKNGEGLLTDAFLSYDRSNLEVKELIKNALNYYGVTTWSDASDIKSGQKFEDAISQGIIEGTNFIFFISPESVVSQYCLMELDIAIAYNKRIIPILISPTPDKDLPEKIRSIDYIHFVDRTNKIEVTVKDHADVAADIAARKEKTPFQKSLDKLLQVIANSQNYYHKHKIYLVQAIRWQEQNKNTGVLLRGFNLDNAKTWLKEGEHKQHKPLPVHKELIAESEAKISTLGSEVFISYSREDSDFATKLNNQLQISGKNTWFDQENIPASADFEQEIKNGVSGSDNFLFVITPDSVTSPYCLAEVEHAKIKGKRFITILARETPVENLPDVLKTIQWINFSDKDFNTAYSELLRTLDVDREFVQKHTKYLQIATEWDSNDRANEFLLSGSAYIIAEGWLQESLTPDGFDIVEKTAADSDADAASALSDVLINHSVKKPAPTLLHLEFLHASKAFILLVELQKRQQNEKMLLLEQERLKEAESRIAEQAKASRRQKWFLVFMFFALIGASYLGWKAFLGEKEAIVLKDKATDAMTVAQNERKQADSARALTKTALDAAILSKLKADSAKLAADKARTDAVRLRILALAQKDSADQQRAMALAQKDSATLQKTIAQKATQTAIAAGKKSLFHLYGFNAKQFANQSISTQASKDNPKNKYIKVWLALTAYELKQEAIKKGAELNEPNSYDPELLEALQLAVATLYGDKLAPVAARKIACMGDLICFQDGQNLKIQKFQPNPQSLIPTLSKVDDMSVNDDYVSALAFDDKNKIAYGTRSGMIFFESQKYQQQQNILLLKMLFNPTRLVSVSNEPKYQIWNIGQSNPINIGINSKLYSITYYKGQLLAVCDWQNSDTNIQGAITAYNFTDTVVKILPKPNNVLFAAIAASPNEQLLVAGTTAGALYQLNLDNNTVYEFPKRHNGHVITIKFSSDGNWMATGAQGGTLMLWFLNAAAKLDITKLEPIIINTGNEITDLDFCFNNNYITYTDSRNIHIRPINAVGVYDYLKQNSPTLLNSLTNSDLDYYWNYYKRGDIEKPK